MCAGGFGVRVFVGKRELGLVMFAVGDVLVGGAGSFLGAC